MLPKLYCLMISLLVLNITFESGAFAATSNSQKICKAALSPARYILVNRNITTDTIRSLRDLRAIQNLAQNFLDNEADALAPNLVRAQLANYGRILDDVLTNNNDLADIQLHDGSYLILFFNNLKQEAAPGRYLGMIDILMQLRFDFLKEAEAFEDQTNISKEQKLYQRAVLQISHNLRLHFSTESNSINYKAGKILKEVTNEMKKAEAQNLVFAKGKIFNQNGFSIIDLTQEFVNRFIEKAYERHFGDFVRILNRNIMFLLAYPTMILPKDNLDRGSILWIRENEEREKNYFTLGVYTSIGARGKNRYFVNAYIKDALKYDRNLMTQTRVVRTRVRINFFDDSGIDRDGSFYIREFRAADDYADAFEAYDTQGNPLDLPSNYKLQQ